MSNSPLYIIEVAVPLPVDTTFSYAVPPPLVPLIQIGKRVLIPFGKRKVTGYILGVTTEPPTGALKEIIDILDPEPLFYPGELEFFRWTASYYLHPLGEVLKAALPSGINVSSRRKTEDGAEEKLVGGKRAKSEVFYVPLLNEAAKAKVRGKGEEILGHIQKTGKISAAALRTLFGDCAQQLRRLVELALIEASREEVYRDPFRDEPVERDSPRTLNDSQASALARIEMALEERKFSPFLLHGVTGSGKTEVYLQAIAHALEMGKTALVLVPEIALTPQLVGRFRQRFACGIAVLHSGLSDGERYDEWRRIRRGEVSIVIGARSAIFAPLENIGILVVDEEHESSYKQSEGLRYNARDLALVRGKMANGVVILGSATPQITTYHAAMEQRFTYLELPERANKLPFPGVQVVDVRGRRGELILPQLDRAVRDTLEQGEQALIFLNRRGFATCMVCDECGHTLRCPNCSVTLTFHRRRNRHCCHYCDYSIPAPSVCPDCSSTEILLLGHGTERIEEEMRTRYPDARIDRMDRDTTTGRGAHARILRKVAERETDILIGTQMIAKGHDFPGVTLVGVVSIDATLNLPDFRSAERAFQLITQVLGRAGRGELQGRVIIQTLAPDHYAIAHAARHDFDGFYAAEIAFRREAGYPPFSYLAALTLSSVSQEGVAKEAESLGAALRDLKRRNNARVEILGPVPPPLAMVRGRHRRQILLKAEQRAPLHRLLALCKSAYAPPATVRMHIDIDPVDML